MGVLGAKGEPIEVVHALVSDHPWVEIFIERSDEVRSNSVSKIGARVEGTEAGEGGITC